MSAWSSPLQHTFRYNVHKVALSSPHFSDQAWRNLLAAVPGSHWQHYGANEVSYSNLLFVQTSQQTTHSTGELLPTFTTSWKRADNILLCYHFEYKSRAANNTAKPSTNVHTTCIGNKTGLKIRGKKRYIPHTEGSTHPQDWLFLTTALAPLGPARFMISGKVLDCMWMCACGK